LDPPVVVSFQIPIREDADKGNGKLHQPFRWKLLHDAIYERFGGWTRQADIKEGMWRDEQDRPVRDKTQRSYKVDVPEERLDELKTLLSRACNTFMQKVIRVEIRGEAHYVSEAPNDEQL